MGPLAQTNDPRETKSWEFGLARRPGWTFPDNPQERMSEMDRVDTILSRATEIIHRNCKVLCVSRDSDKYSPDDLHEFHRGFGHSRMWAQYAEGHRGICLIFDYRTLNAAIQQLLESKCHLYQERVNYTNVSPEQQMCFALSEETILRQGVEPYLLSHREAFYRTFYFTKAEDWAQEHEYRWLAIGDSPEAELISFGSALTGVVAGCDIPKQFLDDLLSQCRKLKVPLARIAWTNGFPRLAERLI
jgi:hypothetical protein